MKKIIGLALALAAAALVFVGCGDETGEGSTKGTKWDTDMTIDATKATGGTVENNVGNRRYWKQLGDNTGADSVAGITTTITVKDENYTSEAGNSGVVGLMFDYNDSISSTRDSVKKDFCIIGFNFKRKVGTTSKAFYYVLREEEVPYDKNGVYDTNDNDLVTATNGANGANLTGETTTLNHSDGAGGFLNGKINSWEEMTVGTDYTYANGEYKVVVSIQPTLSASGLPNAIGYDVFIGKDALTLRKVCTYKVDFEGSRRDSASVTKVTIEGESYTIPCGGVAVYGNAKTQYYSNDGEGVKIVANYKTSSTAGGRKTSFSKKEDFKNYLTDSVIGDLKLTNTSDDNITVIVE